MLNPWLFLGTIAFIASFAVSLLMTSDLGGSLVAGSLALATAFGTAASVNWYHNRSTDRRLLNLRQQLRQLQRRRADEEQAIADLAAEKERVMVALNTMQETLRQRQLPGAMPSATPGPSWNLATQTAAEAPQAAIAPVEPEVQPEFQPASLAQFIREAAATKHKISANLQQLQSELSQVSTEVVEQRRAREQLMQEMQQLQQQQQHLKHTGQTLAQEVQELDRCRQELDQSVVHLETKKQALESGANPLQKALKQLQSQVTALQAELRSLESQVTAKRREKEALEQVGSRLTSDPVTPAEQAAVQQLERQKAQLEHSLATLQQEQAHAIALQQSLPQLESQKAQLEAELAHLSQQQASSQQMQLELKQLEAQKAQLERDLSSLKQQQGQLKVAQDTLQKVEKQIRDRRQEKESLEKQITQLQAQKTALRNQPPAASVLNAQSLEVAEKAANNAHNGQPTSATERPTTRSQPVKTSPHLEFSEQELSDVWTNFMVQLPEYELQALSAIARESNPTRILNRIAADNFTTPEELVHSINQLATEMIGDRIIKVRGQAPPIVMKNYQRTIKKLIETYEYLTE